MASGPEHYKQAEELLAYANEVSQVQSARSGYGFAELVAEAQVHATLALAAATVDATGVTTAIKWANLLKEDT